MLRRIHLPLLVLVLAACGDEGRLADALGKDYGPAIVSYLAADSTHLVVSFLSSPFADRADSARRVTARKVAGYVRDHYPRFKALDQVTVEFMTRKESEAAINKRVAASYTFTTAELSGAGP
jgi:hypothetical protein